MQYMKLDIGFPESLDRYSQPPQASTSESVAVPKENDIAKSERSDGFPLLPFAGIALAGVVLWAVRNRQTPWRDFLKDK